MANIPFLNNSYFSAKVGIGTESPLGELHVKDVSELYTDLNGTDAAVNFLDNNSDVWRIGIRASDNSFRFSQDATSLGTNVRVTFANGGNVGIGTTTPLGKLHVYNTATTSNGNGTASETAIGQDSITLYGHGGTNGQTYGSITWMGGSRRRAMISAVAENADTDYIGLAFYTQGTDGPGNYNESMRISRSGKVGIGTTNPSRDGLNIFHSTLPYVHLTNTTTGDLNSDGGYMSMSGIDLRLGNQEAGGPLVLFTNNDSGNGIIILSNGNVGIGTTSPSNRLEVVGPYQATPLKVLRHADYGNVINIGRNGISETANIGYPADATMNFSTNGSERVRITSTGS